jgi:hypothetical protein
VDTGNKEESSMKRLLMTAMVCSLTVISTVWAIPTEINYQGTLKKNGLPDTNPESVTFQLTSSDGKINYSQPTTVTVNPINGLFSTKLDFQFINGNTWESVTPYIQVSVNGQTLSNPEKVSVTPYAIIASSVVAGAITPDRVAPGYGLVPSGAIMIFQNACPDGWSVFTGLQGKFPVGTDNNTANNFPIASSGGQLNHVHTFTTSFDGAHNHGGFTDKVNPTATRVVGNSSTYQDDELVQDVGTGGTYLIRLTKHDHAISTDGSHNHHGTTDSTSSLPPYLAVVFCIKQ